MANTTNRLAGIAYITVDGIPFMLEADLSYVVSGVTRETLKGQDGVHGYKETPRVGSISMSVRDAGNLSLAAINKMTNVTVTGELANGKTIIGRNMWTVEDQSVKTSESTFECKFEGMSVEEVL